MGVYEWFRSGDECDHILYFKCSGDKFNHIQDHQGVLGSEVRHWRDQTSVHLIGSGMLLFTIQLSILVLGSIKTKSTRLVASELLPPIRQMLNGITPTIIQVRVAMGLSFHDQRYMIETTKSACCV